MAETKQYQDLDPAGALSDTDMLAVSQKGKKELTRTTLGSVANKTAALIEGGALYQLGQVTSAGLRYLGQKVNNKIPNSVPEEPTYMELGNAVDKMDVTGSKELWCGDYWDQRTADYASAVGFYPVPNSNIVISMANDKIIRVNDMTDAVRFPSSKQLTYDASAAASATEIKNMGLAINHNGTKIAYQKDNNTLVVVSVDYETWRLTAHEYTHNLNKGMYEAGYATLNMEGTIYGFKSGYNTYTFLRLTDNVSATVTDSRAAISRGTTWLIWTDEYKACCLYEGANQIFDWVINPDTMAVTITQSAVTTGWDILTSTLAPGVVNYYSDRKLIYRMNGGSFDVYESGIPTANRPGFYQFRTPLYLYFLDSGLSKTVYFSWAMWTNQSSNRTVLNYPAVFIRQLDDDTLRFYISDAGYVDYILSKQQFKGNSSPDGSVFLGNAVKIITTTVGDAAQIDSVFVSEKMNFMVGVSGYISSSVCCCQNKLVYSDKIIGEWLQRGGKYTLLQRAPATEEDLQSGALDPADTVLNVTEGGAV